MTLMHAGLECRRCGGNVLPKDDAISCIQCGTVLEYLDRPAPDCGKAYAKPPKSARPRAIPHRTKNEKAAAAANEDTGNRAASNGAAARQPIAKPEENPPAKENSRSGPMPFGLTPEEAERILSSQESALAWLKAKRWPDGPVCTWCGSKSTEQLPAGREDRNGPPNRCEDCGKAFYLIAEGELPPWLYVRTWLKAVHTVLTQGEQMRDATNLATETRMSRNYAQRVLATIERAESEGREVFEMPRPAAQAAAVLEPEETADPERTQKTTDEPEQTQEASGPENALSTEPEMSPEPEAPAGRLETASWELAECRADLESHRNRLSERAAQIQQELDETERRIATIRETETLLADWKASRT